MAASRVDQEASVDMLALELSRSRLLAPNKTVFNNGIRLAPKGHSGNVWGIWYVDITAQGALSRDIAC